MKQCPDSSILDLAFAAKSPWSLSSGFGEGVPAGGIGSLGPWLRRLRLERFARHLRGLSPRILCGPYRLVVARREGGLLDLNAPLLTTNGG